MGVELAYKLYFEGKTKAAKKIVKRLVERSENPKALFLYALICYQDKELYEAYNALERAINADSEFFEAWILRAKILRHMKRYSEAIESLDRAYELRLNKEDYEDYEILILKAEIYLEMGRTDLARREIRKIKEINPFDDDILLLEQKLGSEKGS